MSEHKQAASSDEIVPVVVEGLIEEAQADSASEIIIVHDEDDGISYPISYPITGPSSETPKKKFGPRVN